MQCIAKTVADGHSHSCGKRPVHVLSDDASRRMHHDLTTGFRWPALKDDTDPLAAFVRVVLPADAGPAPEPTVSILVPAAYFDVLRADPHPDMPPAVAALLATTEATGEPARASLAVPVSALAAFAAVASAHFTEWGEEHIRSRHSMPAEEREALALRARMAYLTLAQLERHQER